MLRTVLPVRPGVELAVALARAGEGEAGRQIVELYGQPGRRRLDQLADDPNRGISRASVTLASTLHQPPDSRLSLRLFGPITLTRDGAPVEWRADETGRSCAEVLAFLAARGCDALGDTAPSPQ